MSKLSSFTGDDVFHSKRLMYSSPADTSLFLSLGNHVDVYFPSHKRSRISAPFILPGEIFEHKEEVSIEVLPDECLFEIFRHLPGAEERSACACVSKRWLSLISNISRDEFYKMKNLETVKSDKLVVDDINLSRSLEGKKATDINLAAIAVGTNGRGGLAKLSIRGSNSKCEVTNVGLKAVAQGCPSLKVLSMCNLPAVGDEGLSKIGDGCQLLEKLDLCQCPGVTDKGLVAIAKSCPNLTDLTIEACPKIGDEGLQAVGRYCPNLKSITIKECSLVGDQGVASLVSSAAHVLTKVKLHSLNITDVSLAVIGHCGKALTDLVLIGLQRVSEKGFWVMGNGHGLQKLNSLMVTSCQGVTDVGLEAVGKGCPNLKQFCLRKCAALSNNGLIAFTKSVVSLESLHLEECHRITHFGIFGTLINCGNKLKALSLVNCLGIQDLDPALPMLSPCKSLQSLSINNCPGFGDKCLAYLGKLCSQLQHVELIGLHGVTDTGILSVLKGGRDVSKVNLSGCVNLSDKAVLALTELHGGTLEILNLDGCRMITDASLYAVANNCTALCDLDVSKCAITDMGIMALASSNKLDLKILSVSDCSMVSDSSLPYLVKLGETLLGLNLQHCNKIRRSNISLLLEELWMCDVLA